MHIYILPMVVDRIRRKDYVSNLLGIEGFFDEHGVIFFFRSHDTELPGETKGVLYV